MFLFSRMEFGSLLNYFLCSLVPTGVRTFPQITSELILLWTYRTKTIKVEAEEVLWDPWQDVHRYFHEEEGEMTWWWGVWETPTCSGSDSDCARRVPSCFSISLHVVYDHVRKQHMCECFSTFTGSPQTWKDWNHSRSFTLIISVVINIENCAWQRAVY